MKIASTKTMTTLLNRVAKEMGITDRHFRYITVSPEVYKRYVDIEIYNAYDNGDYNWETGKIRAIEVEYPSEYYANNNYLTTKDLNRIFKRYKSSIENADDFAKKVIEEMEI